MPAVHDAYEHPRSVGISVHHSCPDDGLSAPEPEEFVPAWYLHSRFEGDAQRRATRFGRWFHALREPSLRCPAPGTETYRFTWLRSFDPAWVVRVERSGERVRLFATEGGGPGGYDPSPAVRTIEEELTLEDWNRLERAVELSDFWWMSVSGNRMGNDGATWVVEGAKQERYHIAYRWSPTDGRFRQLGLVFLDLAGQSDIEPVY